ncbi:RNA-binding protein [Paenibacillus validus]|uniref:RNA-binding protein n=1 Tax=Paenibacillus validus TaxID=44253 RepID=A0A7X2Z8I2_9BACL|nr:MULTISPECIES: RNA-binding protein [Paenibacillus]MED4600773.1 RNA-binding protein [Paenibacillus validus]MED4608314.1 RNA-binding protein [Paenibacillus validus]MUG69695.1 RNA-binding protein [Paenibacillus validus]
MLSRVENTSPSPDLQIPDFQFVTYCFEQYGLNRGIYNTVDEWLYRFGIRDIVARRQTIVDFLTSLQGEDRSKGVYLKFGKGGLTKQLSEFVVSHIEKR